MSQSSGLPSAKGDSIVVPRRQVHRMSARESQLVSVPLLAALRAAGTRHFYADTADVAELGGLLATTSGLIAEVDGNTINQPLVRQVVDRYLDADFAARAAELQHRPDLDARERRALVYAALCARIGTDVVAAFAEWRAWDASLQLHMGVFADPEAAKRVARALRLHVPDVLVKVPFLPYEPASLLVARDLEREGIPVNLTSTFSARQVAVAALLVNATRTNVFMGRLNEGLEADLLGEHVDLEAQRCLRDLRAEDGVKTQLIVASIRDWRTFFRVAGCDVFTAPCKVIHAFLSQTDVGPSAVTSQLETSYQDRLGIARHVESALGSERIARLHRVEPELLDFLRRLRVSPTWPALHDGDELVHLFDDAGFGDFFHAPDAAGWRLLHARKLPDVNAPLTRALALDTLYTLHADADFENAQAVIDAKIDHAHAFVGAAHA